MMATNAIIQKNYYRSIKKATTAATSRLSARQQQQHAQLAPSRLFSVSTSTSSDQSYNVATLAVFGTMCLTTFGLGCWQTKRYFEKIELMEKRLEELKLDPVPLQFTTVTTNKGENEKEGETTMNFQRWILKGKYDFTKEVLVGPRGPPIGALASDGPNSGRSSGGMSSGPQGYYVVTPFRLQETPTFLSPDSDKNSNVVLVNRGWVPISHIQNSIMWNCPKDVQTVVAVQSKMEQPKGFISPPPQTSSKTKTTLPHPIFLYYHRPSIEKATDTCNSTNSSHPLFLTATSSSSTAPSIMSEAPTFPVAPREDTVGEYKITPIVHGGYAFTWFGLSGAGIFMTRKLLLRR